MANISENQNFKDLIDGLHDEVIQKMKGDTNAARVDISLNYELLDTGDVKVSVITSSIVTNTTTQVLGTFES